MILIKISRFFVCFVIAISALSLHAAQESKERLEIVTTSADQKRDIHVTCAMSGSTIEYPRTESHYDNLIHAFDAYKRVAINHGPMLSKGVLSYLIRKSKGLILTPSTPQDRTNLEGALNFYANNLDKSENVGSHDDSIKSESKERLEDRAAAGSSKARTKPYNKAQGNQNNLSCDSCDKTFSLPASLRDHINNIHMRMRHYCPVEKCNKDFSDRSSLNRHKKRHKGKVVGSCCGKDFFRKDGFKTHQQATSIKHF